MAPKPGVALQAWHSHVVPGVRPTECAPFGESPSPAEGQTTKNSSQIAIAVPTVRSRSTWLPRIDQTDRKRA